MYKLVIQILTQIEDRLLAEVEGGDMLELIKHYVNNEIKWEPTLKIASDVELYSEQI